MIDKLVKDIYKGSDSPEKIKFWEITNFFDSEYEKLKFYSRGSARYNEQIIILEKISKQMGETYTSIYGNS